MELSGADSVSVKYDPIQYRIDRIKALRNPKPESDDAEDQSSSEKIKSDEKSPFGRLVKAIKNADLTIDQKKSKLHYAKTALSHMNEEQAKTFVKNFQKLLSFKTPKLFYQTKQYSNPILEKILSEQNELIQKLIEKLGIENDQKIRIPLYSNSIDQYVDYLNKTFEQFDRDPVTEDNSIDVLS